MVPRLHKRGTSFKAACGYVLHDQGKTSSERVAWSMTQHLYGHVEDAWFEMFDTYRNRALLKANAGVEARGRDNKAPVLHYTLSWHASDNPDSEHMRAMTLASLKALGLTEHQAVIAAHSDKEHHHVHVVVNTVHPYTGRTAPLKFTKLEFSKWAEAYEREHGIHCEQRIENNERRRAIAKERKRDHALHDLAKDAGQISLAPKAYQPVKDRSPNRRQWFERKQITDRMKALRAALDHEQKLKKESTWGKQVEERNVLDRKTKAAVDQVARNVRNELKPQWRQLYAGHKREDRYVEKVATHPFERAVYVFRNRTRFANTGTKLTLRQMVPLILSAKKLLTKKAQVQDRERRQLARFEKFKVKGFTDRIWVDHRAQFERLRERQSIERAAQRQEHDTAKKEVTFARAKFELVRESKEAERKSVQAVLMPNQELRKMAPPLVPARTPPGQRQELEKAAPAGQSSLEQDFERAVRHVRQHDELPRRKGGELKLSDWVRNGRGRSLDHDD